LAEKKASKDVTGNEEVKKGRKEATRRWDKFINSLTTTNLVFMRQFRSKLPTLLGISDVLSALIYI
jgi:hypothetical protein